MNDKINGTIEFLAGCLLWLNVLRLLKDKQIQGISLIPIAFFTIWGLWNLWFYPSVDCMWSFFGGINVVLANATWVILAYYYQSKQESLKDKTKRMMDL